jgi:hypothetical protein
MGAELKLKMPLFAIGETKSDVPISYRRYVGIWSGKIGYNEGKGRRAMLIVTEALSDGWVHGYYLYGPPTKYSWEKDAPAGYFNLVGSISDGTLRFKSGVTSIEGKFSGPNVMTLRSTNPSKKSETSTIKLTPLWRLDPAASASIVVPASTERERTMSEPAAKSKTAGPKIALGGDSRCSKMHDKLGCLCAVQNGGGISTDGRSWYSKQGVQSATNEAFVQCQLRAGRR